MQSSILAASEIALEETDRVMHRVSLACLPCRSRHIKCGAEKPLCSRCVSNSLPCTYARSRRGHRRSRKQGETSAPDNYHHCQQQATPRLEIHTPPAPSPTSSASGTGTTGNSGAASNSTTLTIPSSLRSENILTACSIDEDLIGLYYTYFHTAHPCVLPRWALLQHYAASPEPFAPVLLVMQYVGSLFDPAVASEPLKVMAVDLLPPGLRFTGDHLTPHQVQAVLLFSIALYWCDEIEKGVQALNASIQAALELRMHLVSFPTEHGHDDPVLEESWRRTWWQLYVTDAHIAGSTHTFPTKISSVGVNAGLPCEEECYESGEIPLPRTLQEYDMREFLPDDDPGFSSFAHLVGLTRTLDVVLLRNAPTAQSIATICAQTDISMMAWSALLPKSKRSLLNSRREIDMQLFKASMLVNTYVVDLHRRLSDLAYSDVESVARCAPPAPPAKLRSAKTEDTHVHTCKALLAIRRIGDLLPLPSNIVTQTPFIICMIANTLVAHLSACRYLFRGHALQLERERVRSSMGALRALGEYWPLGKRTYREMGIIAREILHLSDQDIPRVEPRIETPQRVYVPPRRSPQAPETSPPIVPEMLLDPYVSFFDFSHLSENVLSTCDEFLAMEDLYQG